ncbi:hypothetical protein SSP531S_48730 [Streptomyces spongiicola]|uniref:Uncharacterized protein n=1 Tax=Streptomyces spongiicola TaxID=1690221 RepID=A0A388T3T6_9ACTN|nr:hypothetical protein SSP531S_48730 [Streptomyces spongiicola]
MEPWNRGTLEPWRDRAAGRAGRGEPGTVACRGGRKPAGREAGRDAALPHRSRPEAATASRAGRRPSLTDGGSAHGAPESSTAAGGYRKGPEEVRGPGGRKEPGPEGARAGRSPGRKESGPVSSSLPEAGIDPYM